MMRSIHRNVSILARILLAGACLALAIGVPQWRTELRAQGYCDFSTEPDIERCFGGIGPQCELMEQDPDTCIAYGTMSISSILHDICCIETDNMGAFCANPDGRLDCQDEFREASLEVVCTFFGDPRIWDQSFGPYPDPNDGDPIPNDIDLYFFQAPAGTRVHPKYKKICPSKKCKPGSTSKDQCGVYCECE